MNQTFKALSIVIFCGFLAACQSGGLKPGSLETSFAPAGWVKSNRGSQATYLCLPSHCKTPQFVTVVPAKVKGNAEEAIRRNIISSGLLKEFGASAGRASGGIFKLVSTRRIVTKSYSGLENVFRLKTREGRAIYVAGRTIIQNNRGTSIISISYSLSAARRNLQRFMSSTTIRRL